MQIAIGSTPFRLALGIGYRLVKVKMPRLSVDNINASSRRNRYVINVLLGLLHFVIAFAHCSELIELTHAFGRGLLLGFGLGLLHAMVLFL